MLNFIICDDNIHMINKLSLLLPFFFFFMISIILFELRYIIYNGKVIINISNPFTLKIIILKIVIIMNSMLIIMFIY